jgi:2-alkenal reductase
LQEAGKQTIQNGGYIVKFFINRQIFLLAVVTVLLISACGLNVDLPSADPDPAEPAATVDTSEIVKAVLAEVEGQLAIQSEEQATQLEAQVVDEVRARAEELAEATEGEVDTESIVETVLSEVQERLALQEAEPVPVIFGNDAAGSAVKDLEAALVTLYQRANPAVVFIIVPPIGSGSGFVFDENGYIVTNNHVVDLGQEFEVVFSSGERQSAELVGQDVDSDLAVIKVDHLPEGVTPLPLAVAEGPQVGQFVAAIGNPFGEQGSMSLGIISGLNRSLSSERESGSFSSYSLPEVIQTDAPINPGNSGGPLLNLLGEVVGVNSAIRTTTGTNSGVSFSIPARAVARIIPSLIADGEFNYSYMGVSFDGEISLDDQTAYGLSQTQGAYVLGVTDGSPADRAGLIPASRSTGRGGDLIVTIDGHTVNDFSDLNSYLVYESTVGQSIEIMVVRDGELVTLALTLGSRP